MLRPRIGMSLDAGQQVLQTLGVQRQIDRVHGLAAKCRIHHHRRKRVFHRIAGHAIDLGSCIHALDAIGVAQFARGRLSGSGFLAARGRTEGEDAACPNSQHAADDALFSHAQADHLVLAGVRLEELHHHHVVVEIGRGRDHLVEVGWILAHLLKRLFQLLGVAEVVVGDDETDAVAKLLKLLGFEGLDALEFQVHQLKTAIGRFQQNAELGCD